MPNHVTNRIEASQEVLDAFLIDGHIDFNSVLPMPADDDPVFTASRTDYGNGMVGYGMDGYSPMDWARRHWNTKWNAYDQKIEEGFLEFDTAWSHPEPVIEALSRKFPNETLSVSYADEDLGANLGQYEMTNGEITQSRDFDNYSNESLDFATQLVYGKSHADLQREYELEEAEYMAGLPELTDGSESDKVQA